MSDNRIAAIREKAFSKLRESFRGFPNVEVVERIPEFEESELSKIAIGIEALDICYCKAYVLSIDSQASEEKIYWGIDRLIDLAMSDAKEALSISG